MSARDEAIERALMESWCNRPDVGISDVRAFDAALTAAGYVVEKGWRTTPAPDGVRVLAGRYAPHGEWVEAVVKGPLMFPFTHWRPLPAPPAGEATP